MKTRTKQAQLDFAPIRARLPGLRGRSYWHSLDELAQTPEFQSYLGREFPVASEMGDPLSRRAFLKLMGASLAFAGLVACSPPAGEKILPYSEQPDPALVPGEALYFATAMPFAGYGLGVLVESHLGRPTKIEGNPNHPASLGATDAFAQASILGLYDPDRAQAVTHFGEISTWEAFVQEARARVDAARARAGEGLRVLTETITSPTLGAQLKSLLDGLPSAGWHQYEPVNADNVRLGALQAFGEVVNTVYHFNRADRVLSLDADFLSTNPAHVRYAREFADRRRLSDGQVDTFGRLYVIEGTPTITGASADHRLSVRATGIEAIARSIANRVGVAGGSVDEAAFSPQQRQWMDTVVRDLQQHGGACLVVAGESQPPVVHALAHAMNDALGNVGQTVVHVASAEVTPAHQLESLRGLVADMNAGRVETLFILGGDPAYTAPADLEFTQALRNVEFRVHLSPYFSATSALCHWHIPETHYLETWGDIRAHDGTATILQPLIAPLYNGRSAYELLAALMGDTRPAYDIVRAYWLGQNLADDFDAVWRKSLHDGVIAGTAMPQVNVSVNSRFAEGAAPVATNGSPDELELIFRPDPTIWDGRFANNGWLQELPKPLTTLTWDNAAFLSPATAARLGLSTEDQVELSYRGRSTPAPIWVMPGHADDSVTVYLGYGQAYGGRVSEGLGFNAYALRPSDAFDFGTGVVIRKTGERYQLASTQTHHSLEGRNLVRVATLETFRENPEFAKSEADRHEPPPSLYPQYRYDGYAWGMAIDLTACIGCNACVVACQVENNIPVVGKGGVLNSREMHWLKVDRYYEGPPESPAVRFQPRLCMHCEKAPCELVCPVEATLHDSEGLNEMIYNRCVGTRYCSNNCPYKVRRFNFYNYVEDIPVVNLMRNPDVTVRPRGVMEKCTYCIQRIEAARVQAENEGRAIRDGEIQTACQQACPTQAIVFGNINDPDSRVSRLKAQPLNYGLLAELGTQPRTTYLAKVWNPNSELET